MSLERLVVLMMEQHPKLHPKMHYVCYVAVVKVYVAVSHHVTVFPDFLSRTGEYQLSIGSWPTTGHSNNAIAILGLLVWHHVVMVGLAL